MQMRPGEKLSNIGFEPRRGNGLAGAARGGMEGAGEIGTSGNGQKRGCNGIKRDTNENLPAAKSTGHVGTQ